MHAALAVHPGSGGGAAARIAGTVAARLREHVDRLDLVAADTVAESRALMARSHTEGLDVLVVLGGDGAAHQAVQFCAGTGVALGVVPCGTGNDLARALGIPAEPFAALDAVTAALASGRHRTIDLGRTGESWFSTVLCSGFDAAVNERANHLPWPRGRRRYDLAAVAELASFGTRPLVVRTDRERLEIEAALVAVGNTPWYGGGARICPDAEPGDGLFDVTVVGAVSRRELVGILLGLRGPAPLRHPAVRTMRAREVSLSGNDWPAYADGEPLGTLPRSITCVPGALTVLA